MLRNRADVLVVGAGMSGLACARRLEDAGLSVTVLDKARGAGGRMSTRRGPAGVFDHGAQHFSARSAPFRQQLENWGATGIIERWKPRAESGKFPMGAWVGAPKASALPRYLSSALVDLRLQTRVRRIAREDGQWRAFDDQGKLILSADACVLAIPAPQAADLLRPVALDLALALDVIAFDPCWAAMVTLDSPLELPQDVYRWRELGIEWAARENSKPRRRGPDRWILHATPRWSRTHLERDAAEVAEELWKQFAGTLGVATDRATHLQAHRWRYARVASPLGHPCLFDPDRAIGACGDWCLDARVEAAWTSGEEMASVLLQSITGLTADRPEPIDHTQAEIL